MSSFKKQSTISDFFGKKIPKAADSNTQQAENKLVREIMNENSCSLSILMIEKDQNSRSFKFFTKNTPQLIQNCLQIFKKKLYALNKVYLGGYGSGQFEQNIGYPHELYLKKCSKYSHRVIYNYADLNSSSLKIIKRIKLILKFQYSDFSFVANHSQQVKYFIKILKLFRKLNIQYLDLKLGGLGLPFLDEINIQISNMPLLKHLSYHLINLSNTEPTMYFKKLSSKSSKLSLKNFKPVKFMISQQQTLKDNFRFQKSQPELEMAEFDINFRQVTDIDQFITEMQLGIKQLQKEERQLKNYSFSFNVPPQDHGIKIFKGLTLSFQQNFLESLNLEFQFQGQRTIDQILQNLKELLQNQAKLQKLRLDFSEFRNGKCEKVSDCLTSLNKMSELKILILYIPDLIKTPFNNQYYYDMGLIFRHLTSLQKFNLYHKVTKMLTPGFSPYFSHLEHWKSVRSFGFSCSINKTNEGMISSLEKAFSKLGPQLLQFEFRITNNTTTKECPGEVITMLANSIKKSMKNLRGLLLELLFVRKPPPQNEFENLLANLQFLTNFKLYWFEIPSTYSLSLVKQLELMKTIKTVRVYPKEIFTRHLVLSKRIKFLVELNPLNFNSYIFD